MRLCPAMSQITDAPVSVGFMPSGARARTGLGPPRYVIQISETHPASPQTCGLSGLSAKPARNPVPLTLGARHVGRQQGQEQSQRQRNPAADGVHGSCPSRKSGGFVQTRPLVHFSLHTTIISHSGGLCKAAVLCCNACQAVSIILIVALSCIGAAGLPESR